jgi:hypothetical protein
MSQLKGRYGDLWMCLHCFETGIPEDAKFCPECGANLIVDHEPPTSPVTNTGQVDTTITETPGGRKPVSSSGDRGARDSYERRQFLQSLAFTGQEAPAERGSHLDSSPEEAVLERARAAFEDAVSEKWSVLADFPEEGTPWEELTPDARHRSMRVMNAEAAARDAEKVYDSAARAVEMRDAAFDRVLRVMRDDNDRRPGDGE